MQQIEILIIGAGPAGLAAGIYGARSSHKTAILEKAFSGGQMALTSDVENYPGFPEPVNGMALAQTMEQQARRFGCEFANGEATRITRTETGITVESSADSFTIPSVIIATGVKARKLDIPGENELVGRGVSYCAVCDGPLFKGKEVAVVGGGDSALDEALYLSGFCSKVYLIHRRDEFRGCKFAQEKLSRRENVTFVLSSTVAAISGHDRVESIELTNLRDSSHSRLPVSGVFIYVGSVPNTGWCADTLKHDETGFILTDDHLRTDIPGVLAAGDVRKTPLRQIATSVGDGALAAMMAHEFLTKGRWQ